MSAYDNLQLSAKWIADNTRTPTTGSYKNTEKYQQSLDRAISKLFPKKKRNTRKVAAKHVGLTLAALSAPATTTPATTTPATSFVA